MVPETYYIALSAILFTIGALGVLIRRNPLIIFMSVELMLKLIRESAEPVAQTAENGNYHQALDTNTPYQMIRIWLPSDSPYSVEISAGRHRLTARFMETNTSTRPSQTANNVDFHLSCCAL